MQQSLIHHPKLTVRQVTGSEGPSHDPYAYEEFHIETPAGSFVAHIGLGVWVQEGKADKINALGIDYDMPRNWVNGYVQKWTGYTTSQIMRINSRIQSRCPKGGTHYGHDETGYPGESFCVCVKCGKMYDFHFNESAVM